MSLLINFLKAFESFLDPSVLMKPILQIPIFIYGFTNFIVTSMFTILFSRTVLCDYRALNKFI